MNGLDAFLLYAGLTAIGLSGLLIVTGVLLIRLGLKERHKKTMLTAALCAVVFVVLYLLRSALFPHRQYAGDHRTLFLVVLWFHTLLAVLNIPMAVVTIYLGLKERFERHKRIAPYTAALWVTVAVSGWVVYLWNS